MTATYLPMPPEIPHKKDATLTVDTFMAEVPIDAHRSILVYLREHGGRQYIRWRVFHRHRSLGHWYPDKRRAFDMVRWACRRSGPGYCGGRKSENIDTQALLAGHGGRVGQIPIPQDGGTERPTASAGLGTPARELRGMEWALYRTIRTCAATTGKTTSQARESGRSIGPDFGEAHNDAYRTMVNEKGGRLKRPSKRVGWIPARRVRALAHLEHRIKHRVIYLHLRY